VVATTPSISICSVLAAPNASASMIRPLTYLSAGLLKIVISWFQFVGRPGSLAAMNFHD